MKGEGEANDLVDRIADDPRIPVTREEILEMLKPENFIGRAPEQTEEFLEQYVDPILAANGDSADVRAEIQL